MSRIVFYAALMLMVVAAPTVAHSGQPGCSVADWPAVSRGSGAMRQKAASPLPSRTQRGSMRALGAEGGEEHFAKFGRRKAKRRRPLVALVGPASFLYRAPSNGITCDSTHRPSVPSARVADPLRIAAAMKGRHSYQQRSRCAPRNRGPESHCMGTVHWCGSGFAATQAINPGRYCALVQ
jgi:hypothetical protein